MIESTKSLNICFPKVTRDALLYGYSWNKSHSNESVPSVKLGVRLFDLCISPVSSAAGFAYGITPGIAIATLLRLDSCWPGWIFSTAENFWSSDALHQGRYSHSPTLYQQRAVGLLVASGSPSRREPAASKSLGDGCNQPPWNVSNVSVCNLILSAKVAELADAPDLGSGG